LKFYSNLDSFFLEGLTSSSNMLEFQCLAYGVEPDQDGICLLISVGEHRILLDCGLKRMFPLFFDLKQRSERLSTAQPLTAIFCSHAHADHARGLFELQKAYPEIPIFLSRATAKLLDFYQNTQHYSPTFQNSVKPLEWRSPIAINHELTLELLPVGHLPGAAACFLQYTPEMEKKHPKTLLYTGDVCLSNSRLTDSLPLQSYRSLSPDILILEGTLGTTKLPNHRQQENQLIQEIKTVLDDIGKVAILIDPLGMAQELLLLFKSHPLFANQPIQIWIDPDIQQACDLMLGILEELPNRVQNFAKTQTLFLEFKLFPQIKVLNHFEVLEHCDRPTIVMLSDSSKVEDQASMFKESWTFFCPLQFPSSPLPSSISGEVNIQPYTLENHPDSQGILQLIHNLKPQHVAFCHGSISELAELCCLEELISRYHLHLPQKGKTLDILVGLDRLISQAPSLTEMMFEGELKENQDRVSIELPKDVTQDNRWEAIADSGIILATWQGESLIIKGISQRELISNHRKAIDSIQNTCVRCKFYNGLRCLCIESVMYRQKVSPEGFCPEYQDKIYGFNPK
jgi:Cft2 family RNA processing exonuclease